MAEINERANTSIDCSLSPTASISSEVQKLSDEVSQKLNSFVSEEIQSTVDDYKLLEDMNNVTSQRYSDMKHVAESISTKLLQLHEKYKDIQPFLQQVDEVDNASRRMEEAVSLIENYVIALEGKLKKMQHSGESA